MELIEREPQLAQLSAALRATATRQGQVVLVTGEAGVGKTSLLREFTADADTRTYWGMCDELTTPRPLGPFRDIARQIDASMTTASTVVLLDAIAAELDSARTPSSVIVEDAHWADDATLDAIRFLGRRISRLRALLAVTFRDDEVPAGHPLRRAIGVLPPDDVLRIEVPRLSLAGVSQLAHRADVADLYRVTGGNPFYVTELLESPGSAVPLTVQDAVMSRVGELSHGGRACVETAAVVPNRVERWVLEGCGVAERVDEASRLGLLHVRDDDVCFSHELVRRAIEHSLPSVQRRALNRQVLSVLATRDADPARMAHHAVQADDAGAIAEYAPIAAAAAAAVDAHREAVAHYSDVLRVRQELPVAQQAELLRKFGHQCFLAGRAHLESGAKALNEAVDLAATLAADDELGASLTLLSEVEWLRGNGHQAREAATRAVAILERHPISATLARAFAQQAKLALVDRRLPDAIAWGERAIAAAQQTDDTGTLSHALNTVGWAKWMTLPHDNSQLLDSLQLALQNGLTEHVERAYVNLVAGFLEHHDYEQAGRYLDDAMAFCQEHDMLTAFDHLVATKAIWHVEQGHWDEAEKVAKSVNRTHSPAGIALTTLASVYTRRGNAEAAQLLEEAQEFAERSGDAQDLLPTGLVRLELAWQHGQLDEMKDLAVDMYALARDTASSRLISAAALWLHRVGGLTESPPESSKPVALHIAGHHAEAAALYADAGRPYAEADALADASDPELLLRALEILHRLGAKPRAAMVERRLRDMGVPHIPRGPRAAARSSAGGLTERQTEVLKLLADDLTFQEIAQRLHLSVKTVDHHATAVRTKLDASNRNEAVEAGRRLGILAAD